MTVCITALPTIAVMVGANRVVHGFAITSPAADTSRDPVEEEESRVRIVERAIAMMEAEVAPRTTWEVL